MGIPRENGEVDNVAFDYRLTDEGWAEASFRVGRENAVLAVSHTGGPLDRLIAAVLAVGEGEDRTQVLWQARDDGKQWWSHILWLFDRRSDRIHVLVTKGRRGGGGQQGGTQFDGECSVLALCTAVTEGVDRLYLRDGKRRYAEIANAPFPVEGLDRLEKLARDLAV